MSFTIHDAERDHVKSQVSSHFLSHDAPRKVIVAVRYHAQAL